MLGRAMSASSNLRSNAHSVSPKGPKFLLMICRRKYAEEKLILLGYRAILMSTWKALSGGYLVERSSKPEGDRKKQRNNWG